MKNKTKMTLCVLTLSLIVSAIFVFSTKNGLGVVTDSVFYLQAADNFFNLGELVTDRGPLTHYTPLYSLSISFVTHFFGEPLVAAFYLQWFFYLFCSFLLFVATYRASGKSIITGFIFTLFFVFSPSVIRQFTGVMSEAAFICLAILIILTSASYLDKNSRQKLLLLGVLLPMCILTRYVGAALFFSTLLSLLLLDKKNNVNTKILNIIALVVPTVLIVAFWLIRNQLVSGGVTNRTFSYHPFGFGQLESMLKSISLFFLPLHDLSKGLSSGYNVVCVLILLLAPCLVAVVKYREGVPKTRITIGLVSLLFCISYALFLILSISFFDYSTPLNERILLPLNIAFLICLSSAVNDYKKVIPKLYVMFIVFVLLAVNIASGVNCSLKLNRDGYGYSSPSWRSLQLVSYAKSVNDLKIYTNAHDALGFLTGRKVNLIPRRYFASSRLENIKFNIQMEQFLSEIQKEEAIVIYFNRITWRKYLPTLEELKKRLAPSKWCDIEGEGSYLKLKNEECT